MSINKVILVGNVGKDPETRHLENGNARSSFSLATTETYVKNGEKISNTEWHNIVTWGKLAEIVEKYVRKGTLLYIEGKIQTRSYDDKDGVKKYITDIVADTMKMLSKRSDDQSSASSNQVKASEPEDVFSPDENNDLPF